MDLTLADFALALLLGSFALVFLFATVSRTLHARAESRSLSRRVICRICLAAFEDAGTGGVVDCPRCGAANERGRSRRLG